MPEFCYHIQRRGSGVYLTRNVRTVEIPVSPRLDLENHSPTGLEYGYPGSGPAQLALAVLADYLRDDRRALDLHQEYKFDVIAKLDQNQPRHTITTASLDEWLSHHKPEED
jgi:hypothetical protein